MSENRGSSSSSSRRCFLQLPKALRQRPAFIDALSTKDATREDVLREVEDYENKAKKLSEECSRAAYKLCVRIRAGIPGEPAEDVAEGRRESLH